MGPGRLGPECQSLGRTGGEGHAETPSSPSSSSYRLPGAAQTCLLMSLSGSRMYILLLLQGPGLTGPEGFALN